MTKMCENCGYVGDFEPDRRAHYADCLCGCSETYYCGKLRPYVLDRNRPESHGALAPSPGIPGAKQ